MRGFLSVAIALSLLSAACRDTSPPETTSEPTDVLGSLDFDNVTKVVGGLDVPWEVAFVDERTILVTERPGRVRVIREGRLQTEPVAEIEVSASGEGGLLGLALHPEFPRERSAYLYYTSGDENRVSRFTLDDTLRFSDEQPVVDAIPAGAIHDGGRIAFGPDGMLYIGTGDAGESRLAAERGSLAGKVLRITPEGSVPDDNPFDGSAVYSYGHRNVQGLDWDEDGNLYASEHGPTGEFGLCCHDEINRIQAGSFYGWPFRTGRERADEGSPPRDPTDPVVESGEETWAPAGLAVHEAEGQPKRVFVATLKGERLMSVDVERPADPDVALDGVGRLRVARFGPDGCLYLATSNTDGRGAPRDDDDRLLRICPPD